MRTRLLAAVLGLLVLLTAPASAQFTFGGDEKLHTIVDVPVVIQNDEALMLGFKTTTQNFILPHTIADDGYVLVVKDDRQKFYSLTPEQISQWQAQGLIPDPLPSYEIPLIDRIIGYALWPTLLLIALVYLIPAWRKRKAAAVAASTIEAPPPAMPSETHSAASSSDDKGPVT
jgi:hypothetical protein